MTRLFALLASIILFVAGAPVAADADPAFLPAPQTAESEGPSQGRSEARRAKLTLRKLTAVISSRSGWQASVTVKNMSRRTIPPGILTALISPYSIQSASLAQNWAEGRPVLRTPLILGTVRIRALAPGASRTLNFTVSHDDPNLTALRTWGAKPVLFDYSDESGTTIARLYTFSTRSHEGLEGANNPPITLTLTLPLSSTRWQAGPEALHRLVTSSTASAQIISLPREEVHRLSELSRLASKNPNLQVVSDPMTLALRESTSLKTPVEQGARRSTRGGQAKQWGKSRTPGPGASAGGSKTAASTKSRGKVENPIRLPARRLAGVTQPFIFNIPATATVSEKKWRAAGVTPADWSAQTARNLLAEQEENTTTGSPASSPTSVQPIAWQGDDPWNTSSLTAAAREGYRTVVSTSAAPIMVGANQETGRIAVPTAAGTVTVLLVQQELSALASGLRTSPHAQAENSDAGRVARLTAQSSIYESEQPYVARNLLVSFGRSAQPNLVQDVLNVLPSCDWIHAGSLDNLEKGQSGTPLDKTGARASDPSDFSLGADEATRANSDAKRRLKRSSLERALDILEASRGSITRVSSAIIDPKEHRGQKAAGNTDNPQNLATQNALQAEENHVTLEQWLSKLRFAHLQAALIGLSASSPESSPGVVAARNLSAELLDAVSLTPPDHVNIFSQSARMPVTVRNSLPFPIRVSVKAKTDIIATTITPSRQVHVLANAESQVNFTVRAIGLSQTRANFSLIDSRGRSFGQNRTAAIYSQLSLSDMSGYILIAIAVLLGLAGFWRQFHVRKDPNQ